MSELPGHLDCEVCLALIDVFERRIVDALEPYLGQPADVARATAKRRLVDLLDEFDHYGVEIRGEWPDLRIRARHVSAHVHD